MYERLPLQLPLPEVPPEYWQQPDPEPEPQRGVWTINILDPDEDEEA